MHVPAMLEGFCLHVGVQGRVVQCLQGTSPYLGQCTGFCHDTVQPPLPEIARILAEYMKWMPEACRSQAMSLCSMLIKE